MAPVATGSTDLADALACPLKLPGESPLYGVSSPKHRSDSIAMQ